MKGVLPDVEEGRISYLMEKVLECLETEGVTDIEGGRVVYAMVVTGCVRGDIDDDQLDDFFWIMKKNIQRERDKRRMKNGKGK